MNTKRVLKNGKMGLEKVAVVERFKEESMKGLSAKISGRCREVGLKFGL